SLGPGRARRRHPDGRAGRVVQDPLARGGPRDVALPLPRRVAHDGRGDRPLPRDAVRRLAVVPVLAALAAPAAARADETDIGIGFNAFGTPKVSVLTGDTVKWTNV